MAQHFFLVGVLAEKNTLLLLLLMQISSASLSVCTNEVTIEWPLFPPPHASLTYNLLQIGKMG